MKRRRDARLHWLKNNLANSGGVHLSEAARQFGVSQMTIRRDVDSTDGDLTLLAGRIFMSDSLHSTTVYDLNVEKDSHQRVKQQLGARAATFIEPDDTVFIDCGSTLINLVSALDRDLPLTIVTYALNIANAISSRLPNAQLLLYGGLYHASSQSFSGEGAANALRQTGINKAFISAAGADMERGISCFNFHEVEPKRAALETAQQCILVADSSKMGKLRPALFADWDQFDTLLTDTPITGPPLIASGPSGPTIVQI
ncbi:DeoR family transcriptional regulator [Salinisphaera orenii]|uniref:DeoR family transcriptional regulator n=1 Tax=Salinisphaera orenii TaxID=856731 RepID=UPI000DBE243D